MTTIANDLPVDHPAKWRGHVAAGAMRKAGHHACTAPCASCGVEQGQSASGRPTVVLHHPDYDRPDLVIPLCRSCHGRVHLGTLPEPVTGRIYPRRSRHNAHREPAERGAA